MLGGRAGSGWRPARPFDRAPTGAVLVDDRFEVGRLEVDLGDPRATVAIGGAGTLVLTGSDRFQGKPVSLQVADGTLRLEAPLRVEVRG